MAVLTTALIAAFIPGESPPDVSTAIFLISLFSIYVCIVRTNVQKYLLYLNTAIGKCNFLEKLWLYAIEVVYSVITLQL